MTSITLHEMEDVARQMGAPEVSFSADLGNVIEISDANDSLGLNMLMNPGRTAPRSEPSGQSSSFSVPPASNGVPEIEISQLDSLEPVQLDLGGDSHHGGGLAPVEVQFSRSESDHSAPSLFSNLQSATGPGVSLAPAPAYRIDPEVEKKEKIEHLNKLQRLENKGFPLSRKFTMDNTLDEMKQEVARLVDARNLEGSLRFQRQALMGVVTGLEWLNGRFDPFDLKLEGWSESVHENVEDFDEIFEELYDKYKDRGKMPPEARLLMTLAGSGFMMHVSNTFLRSRMPSMDDLLRKNPDLAKQFATAAAQSAGPGFGNFMGMAMGGGAPPAAQPQGPGAFFGSSAAESAPPMMQTPQPVASVEPPRATARKEMRGPSGVDDILRTFEEARRQEQGAFGSPMGPPQTQPAVAAAVEIQSMASGDDLGSMADSTRTGKSRRRRAAVGNTVSLNV